MLLFMWYGVWYVARWRAHFMSVYYVVFGVPRVISAVRYVCVFCLCADARARRDIEESYVRRRQYSSRALNKCDTQKIHATRACERLYFIFTAEGEISQIAQRLTTPPHLHIVSKNLIMTPTAAVSAKTTPSLQDDQKFALMKVGTASRSHYVIMLKSIYYR